MPLTRYAPLTNRNQVTKRHNEAWRALNAIANGLNELDAQLLYGFTEEELASFRLAWEQRRSVSPSGDWPASVQEWQ